MKKSLLVLTITVFLITLCFTPLISYAFVRNGEGEASLLQEGELDLLTAEEAEYSAKAQSNTSISVSDFLYSSLLNVPESVDITNYKIPVSSFAALYSDVINDHPDLFYISSSYTYNYNPNTNCIYSVTPHYVMSKDKIDQAKTVFNKGVSRILSEINDGMTDLQKALTVHDAVCSLAHYPEISNTEDDKDIYHSAYGLFYDGEVVCAGYTLAYSYLLNELDIPCEYVASVAMQHAWNKIKIDGKWYNVDCTWDDLDYGTSISLMGSVKHKCFMKSDTSIESETCYFHYDGVTFDECTANDTSYDEYFWNDVTSRIYTVDYNYYYVKPSSTAYTTLGKRTLDGTESSFGTSFRSANMNGTSYPIDSSGQQHTVVESDFLARLAYLDSRFYVISNGYIISLSLSGRKYNIVTVATYPMGFGVNEKNNLVYQLYGSADTKTELDKLDYFNRYLSDSVSSVYNNYPDINYDLKVNAKDYAYILRALDQ